MAKAQDLANQLFNGMQSQLREGIGNFGPQISSELGRLGTQGAMELASALFSGGNAFVPYGPGQYTPSVQQDHQPGQQQDHQQDHQRESRGMER